MKATIKDFQNEIGSWISRNFPDATPQDGFMVLAEELGELSHSWIKRKQGIRMDEDHDEKVRDAVADIFISLCGFCSLEGLDLNAEVISAWAEVRQRDWRKTDA